MKMRRRNDLGISTFAEAVARRDESRSLRRKGSGEARKTTATHDLHYVSRNTRSRLTVSRGPMPHR